MAKAKDFTGLRFGHLVVLGLDPTPYRSPAGKSVRRWRCRCDCGNAVIVLPNALSAQKNGTRSCGCAKREAIRKQCAVDMTGQRVGRLFVLNDVTLDKPESNGNTLGWRCRCDCGKEIIATRKDFLSGLQSCGCLLSETARRKVEEENVFGHYSGTTISAIKPGRKVNSNNKSGFRGVYWSNREECWVAKIGFRRKTITLGRFRDFDEACKARAKAEKEIFSPIIEEYEGEILTQPDDGRAIYE